MTPTPTCATSITITFKAEGCSTYINQVSGLLVGNMVDPKTQQYWYGPCLNNPWTWNNDGTNCNAFALLGNYFINSTPTTAYSEVVIDPTQMGAGAHEVVVTLYTAAIDDDKSNSILMFRSATLDGKASAAVYVQPFPGQSPASFYDC
jgi:hypothetical protein